MPPRKSLKEATALGRKGRYIGHEGDQGSDDGDGPPGDDGDTAAGPSAFDDLPIMPSVEGDDDDDPFASDDDEEVEPSDDDEDLLNRLLVAVREGSVTTDEARTVLQMVGDEEVRAQAEYEERALDEQPESGTFNEVLGGEDASIPFGPVNLPLELRPKEKADPADPSEPVRHYYNPQLEMSLFEKGLAMFAELTGMSRSEYKALYELMHLLKCHEGGVLPDISKLPKNLASLKNRLRVRLPLIDMRKTQIQLKIEKLPTETATQKRDRKGKSKKRQGETQVTESTLYFFDPISLFHKLLSSDVVQDMHSGPGLFVDEPRELYHAPAWLSSVRASAGVYPHLKINGQNGAVLFPSDWIYYRCSQPTCACQHLDENSQKDAWHVGRVTGFGYDRRSIPATSVPDELVLEVQEAFYHDHPSLPDRVAEKLPFQPADEVVLTSAVTYVPESKVWSHASVFVDRAHGETHEDPAPSKTWLKNRDDTIKKADAARKRKEDAESKGQKSRVKIPVVPVPFPKYTDEASTLPARAGEDLVARFMWDVDMKILVPLCHTHPVRAELELEVYSRNLFETQWDIAVEGVPPTVACPVLTFIDGFGVYRNSYRTLTGFYMTPAGLSEDDRSREANVFPVILGPHGSKFGDVVSALQTLRYLDEGVQAEINGQTVRMCVFTMCYTGDMPQQAENCGFKGPRANKFCRFCHFGAKTAVRDPAEISGAQSGSDTVLDFDVISHGRFHVQTGQMQNMMANHIYTAANKDAYGSQWGINNPDPPLMEISPALDKILSCPPDPAHSEYNGLSCLMHFLLRDVILTGPARTEYSAVLRGWPFPPGAARLMSPLHHLASYNMSAHARWSIIVPALLRDWLTEDHMVVSFATQAKEMGNSSPVDFVVSAYAALAKSNSVLMGRKITSNDRENMVQIIRRGRYMFTQLNLCASRSTLAGSRAGSVARGSVGPAPAPSPEPGTIVVGGAPAPEMALQSATTEQAKSAAVKRSVQFVNDTHRPNVHMGAHFQLFLREYGLTKSVGTMEGEHRHKRFKNQVLQTNGSNIEKVLLEKDNLAKTLRLVLRNAASDDAELTQDLAQLSQQAPTLFKSVLSETDRVDLAGDELVDALDVDGDQTTANQMHIRSSVINAIPTVEVRKDGTLPLRAGQIGPDLEDQLRLAYELDFGFAPGEPVVLGNLPIQWARKFAFHDGTSKYEDRYVFGLGDYVEFRGNRLGLVDGIMLFDCMGVYRHIFVFVKELRRTNSRDPVLDLEVFDQKDERIVVGLGAIKPVKRYLVPVEGVGTVLVDWDVHYL